jgi:hypothetical protein
MTCAIYNNFFKYLIDCVDCGESTPRGAGEHFNQITQNSRLHPDSVLFKMQSEEFNITICLQTYCVDCGESTPRGAGECFNRITQNSGLNPMYS